MNFKEFIKNLKESLQQLEDVNVSFMNQSYKQRIFTKLLKSDGNKLPGSYDLVSSGLSLDVTSVTRNNVVSTSNITSVESKVGNILNFTDDEIKVMEERIINDLEKQIWGTR